MRAVAIPQSFISFSWNSSRLEPLSCFVSGICVLMRPSYLFMECSQAVYLKVDYCALFIKSTLIHHLVRGFSSIMSLCWSNILIFFFSYIHMRRFHE